MPADSSVTAASLSRGPIGPGIGRVSLPKPLTSFIGRERELAQATRLLQGSYLVTLTGPGGSGKTRLCIAGRQVLIVLDNFEHLLAGAPVVTRPLQKAGELRILVSSRARQSAGTGSTTRRPRCG